MKRSRKRRWFVYFENLKSACKENNCSTRLISFGVHRWIRWLSLIISKNSYQRPHKLRVILIILGLQGNIDKAEVVSVWLYKKSGDVKIEKRILISRTITFDLTNVEYYLGLWSSTLLLLPFSWNKKKEKCDWKKQLSIRLGWHGQLGPAL